jgi:hypothetical protein
MPNGTNRPPVREVDRIALLERTVARQQQQIDNLLRAKPRTHPRQIEFARTIADPAADPTYPIAETQAFPIVFVDMEESAGSPRSAAKQAYAHCPISTLIPVDTLLIVKLTRKGRWAVVSIVPEDGCTPFLGWLNFGDLEEDLTPAYVLSLSGAGCLKKTPAVPCEEA